MSCYMMKVILVNERLGDTRTYVIKGWLKSVLSLCLLGAPVAIGYLGYQLSLHTEQSGAAPYDTAVQQSLRGMKPTEVQFSSSPGNLCATGLPMMSERESPPSVDEHSSSCTPAGLAVIDADHSFTTIRLSPTAFRHGRIVDPATYQRRVYS